MFLQLFYKFEEEKWRKRVRERDRETGKKTKADHPYEVDSTDDPGISHAAKSRNCLGHPAKSLS